jgi:hypothetical protein
MIFKYGVLHKTSTILCKSMTRSHDLHVWHDAKRTNCPNLLLDLTRYHRLDGETGLFGTPRLMQMDD